MAKLNYDEFYDLAKINDLSYDQILIATLSMASIDLALRLSEKLNKDIKDISMEDLIKDQIGDNNECDN